MSMIKFGPRMFAAATVMVAAGFVTTAASAESSYPSKDVTMVVPFGAGGGSDVLGRTIAKVANDLKVVPTKILVENRPGGSGAIGYSYIARKKKGDPYTLGTVSVSFFTTPLFGGSPVNYKDFTPVAAIAMSPYILVVRADSKIHSLKDMANAKRLTTGSVGKVSDAALLAQMTQDEIGVKMDVVPFDGEGETVASLLGGHIDCMYANPSEVLPQLKAGKLRPIAVSTSERLKSLPKVPTFKERGYDIVHVQLRGIVMPSGVPHKDVVFWENALQKVATSKEWKTQYLDRFKEEAHFVKGKAFEKNIEQTNALYKKMMTKLGVIKK